MSRLRLGILISGGGTTFLNLNKKIQAGQLAAQIACVVSSSSKATGLEKARRLGYPSYVVGRRKYPSDIAFSTAIDQHLLHHKVDLVVLGGFLKKYLPEAHYGERCINIHPSLIPAFCGAGFYGMRVHEAVWRRSCKITGCTVHLVNENYDEGPIILQKTVPVHHEDTAQAIQKKVFALECQALPEAICYFADNRIRFEKGRAIISDSDCATSEKANRDEQGV